MKPESSTLLMVFHQLLFLGLDQSSAFLTLEMLSRTSNGVTFPSTVTFCFGRSMLNDVTPSIFEMCFLTFPAQPWQWSDTLSTTTSVASADDEEDAGWSLMTTGDFLTGFGTGDGWYGTIADWSIALQLKRLIELLLLRWVDLLGFCWSIPLGLGSIPLALWSALLRRRSVVLFLGRSLRLCSGRILLGSKFLLPCLSSNLVWLPCLTRDRCSRLRQIAVDAGEAQKISIAFILQHVCFTQNPKSQRLNAVQHKERA